MKRIVFLINSLGKGGAERVMVNLAEHFTKNGYEMLLVTSRIHSEEYQLHFPVKRIILEDRIAKAPFGRIGKVPARFFALRKIWKQEQPDMILSFIGKLNLYAMLSAWKLKIPVFLSVRSDPAKEYPGKFQKALAEVLFRRAAGIFFQTEDALRFFSKKVQEHGTVLPNPLDESFIGERFEGCRDDEIVMVGRLDANKNHKMLLQAFAPLKERYPEIKLVFYGAGLEGSDTEPELRELTNQLGLSGRVLFQGRQSNIHEKIEKARIFVLASDYEGMPNALLEAMAAGLAVISTDCPCGGPGTVIKNNENGILIPVKDTEALRQAICRILDDKELEERLGKNAAELGENLRPERVCAEWQKEIESRYQYVSSKS